MNGDIVGRRVVIGPQKARNLIESSAQFRNRTLKKWLVSQMAEDMRSGAFQQHYSPILIDTRGFVIDGNHRLHAIVESGCEIEVTIVSGVPETAFEHVDLGARRSAGDTLDVMGVKNWNAVATALAWLRMYRSGALKYRTYRALRAFEAAEAYKGDTGVSDCVRACHRASTYTSVGMVAAFLHLFREKDRLLANMFIEEAIGGLGGKKGDPAWELHRRWVENALSKRKAHTTEVAAWTVKAWNALRDGREVANLRWRIEVPKAEPFPVIR